MYLNEINTNYHSRNVVFLTMDGVTPGISKVTVQHVAGPVYKTYPMEGADGKATVDLYVAWDTREMLLLHRHVDHHRTTVEGVIEYAKQAHMDSYESYMAYLDKLSSCGGWVSVVDIEFARRNDPVRHEKYVAVRHAYLEEQEAKRRARAEARMAAQNKKREEERLAELERCKKMIRWIRDMSALPLPLRYRKLRQAVEVEGELMSWVEFLVIRIAGGWKPHTYKDERNGKRMYRLRKGDASYRLNEMQYNYAVYLAKHLPAIQKKKDEKGVSA